MRTFVLFLILAAAVASYFLLNRPLPSTLETAYILTDQAQLLDQPSEVRTVSKLLTRGERVEILLRRKAWLRVRIPGDGEGWVDSRAVVGGDDFEAGRELMAEVTRAVPQAAGHTAKDLSVRLAPSREAPQLGILKDGEKVQVFARRVVPRAQKEAEEKEAGPEVSPAAEPQPGAPREPVGDPWYLIRAESAAGWVLGRSVALDVPEEIAGYAQDVNLVAWLVLGDVEDENRKVPIYLVADRIGIQDYDFNHIRVFTWGAKRGQYATGYVESNLNGYFPLVVRGFEGRTFFRLRLVDGSGRKFQKVYALEGNLVRSLGAVEGWESGALPEESVVGGRTLALNSRRGR